MRNQLRPALVALTALMTLVTGLLSPCQGPINVLALNLALETVK